MVCIYVDVNINKKLNNRHDSQITICPRLNLSPQSNEAMPLTSPLLHMFVVAQNTS